MDKPIEISLDPGSSPSKCRVFSPVGWCHLWPGRGASGGTKTTRLCRFAGEKSGKPQVWKGDHELSWSANNSPEVGSLTMNDHDGNDDLNHLKPPAMPPAWRLQLDPGWKSWGIPFGSKAKLRRMPKKWFVHLSIHGWNQPNIYI